MVLVGPVSILAEVLHLDQAAALIVELMAIGLAIAKLVIGRTSVTAVENGAI